MRDEFSRESGPPPRPPRLPRGRKVRNALLAFGLALAVSLLAAEIVLRLILFQPGLIPGRLGRSLRLPERFSDGNDEDDYWKLVCTFQGESALVDAHHPDPITGWTSAAVTPGSYAHIDESSIGERRPVLLFGDSFAQCATPPGDCFQSILERSEFAEQYALLNYGTEGYGLDQIQLLLENSIDRFIDRNPIVIVGILVDSDLERSILSFRCWPKPRLDVVEGGLRPRGPVQSSTSGYLEQNPIAIRSYLWRLFLHQRSAFMADARARWRGASRIEAEKQALNRRILIEIERGLARRGLQHFFLVFHSEGGALARWKLFEWQEKMIEDVCAELAIPLIDTRPFLSCASEASPEMCARLYGHGDPLRGHHNRFGNLVCFEAIAQGLRGDFGPPDLRQLEELKREGLFDSIPEETTATVLLGRDATLITHGSEGRLRATETQDPARFLLRADALGPTSAKFALAGAARRFTGRLHTMMDQGPGCANFELRFKVEIDDAVVFEVGVPPAAEALALDFDLHGKRSMAFSVTGDRGGTNCNWICIEDPRLE